MLSHPHKTNFVLEPTQIFYFHFIIFSARAKDQIYFINLFFLLPLPQDWLQIRYQILSWGTFSFSKSSTSWQKDFSFFDNAFIALTLPTILYNHNFYSDHLTYSKFVVLYSSLQVQPNPSQSRRSKIFLISFMFFSIFHLLHSNIFYSNKTVHLRRCFLGCGWPFISSRLGQSQDSRSLWTRGGNYLKQIALQKQYLRTRGENYLRRE